MLSICTPYSRLLLFEPFGLPPFASLIYHLLVVRVHQAFVTGRRQTRTGRQQRLGLLADETLL
jgi:hypothetical protein